MEDDLLVFLVLVGGVLLFENCVVGGDINAPEGKRDARCLVEYTSLAVAEWAFVSDVAGMVRAVTVGAFY
jgi:hypothetical protein